MTLDLRAGEGLAFGNLGQRAEHVISEIVKKFIQDGDVVFEKGRKAFLDILDGTRFTGILEKLGRVQVPAPPPGSRTPAPARSAPVSRPGAPGVPNEPNDLDGAQVTILNTLATLARRGLTPDRVMVARWIGIHPNGGRYNTNLARLREAGYLDGLTLTERGLAVALDTNGPQIKGVKERLDGAQSAIVDVLVANTQTFNRVGLAEALGIHPNGGRYNTNLARLREMGLIPERGDIQLTEAAFQ